MISIAVFVVGHIKIDLRACAIRTARTTLSRFKIEAELPQLLNPVRGHRTWLPILMFAILVTDVKDPSAKLFVGCVPLRDAAMAGRLFELVQFLQMVNPAVHVVLGVRFVLWCKVKFNFVQLLKSFSCYQ